MQDGPGKKVTVFHIIQKENHKKFLIGAMITRGVGGDSRFYMDIDFNWVDFKRENALKIMISKKNIL